MTRRYKRDRHVEEGISPPDSLPSSLGVRGANPLFDLASETPIPLGVSLFPLLFCWKITGITEIIMGIMEIVLRHGINSFLSI